MKIAFTSCFRYEAFPVQKEWDYILAQNPDYLFLLGDSIYMDFGYFPFSKEPVGKPRHYSTEKFRAIMNTKYRNQFEKVNSFKTLVDTMREKNGFYAIWDDHDFAWDNSKGALICNEKKNISRELFHYYTKCSTNMPHVFYHVDTPLARVIFLDNRTDAEDSGANSILLSEEQFSFIEDKIEHSLPYTLICGGLTLTEGNENWTKYPAQLTRLCNLLEGRKKVFFLSGDIHYNDFKKPIFLKKLGCTTPPQLISSGMQINYLGLGLGFDNKHNWAMLSLEENTAAVTFYKGSKPQKKLTEEANKWIQQNY